MFSNAVIEIKSHKRLCINEQSGQHLQQFINLHIFLASLTYYQVHFFYFKMTAFLFNYIWFLGLSLELNIEQEQYIGALTPEAGVRIHISDQREMPFPLDKGLSLAPGYATSIGMRKVGSISHLLTGFKKG